MLVIKIYKYKLESFGRTPLSQQGPFSGVSLSGEQKKYLNSLIQCNGLSTGNHI